MMATFLISVVIVGLIASFYLQHRRLANQPELVTSFSIVLIAFGLNIAFPATLAYAIKGGNLAWAPSYSNSTVATDALLISIVALCSLCIGYYIYGITQSHKIPLKIHPHMRSKASALANDETTNPTALIAPLTALLLLGILLKLAAAYNIGLGPEIIARMSGSIRREMAQSGAESGVVHYFILLSTIADGAAAILFYHALKFNRHVILSSILVLLLFSATYILSGKRSLMILPLTFMICAFATLRGPITLRSLPLVFFGIIALGMISLLVRAIVPQLAVGNIIDYRLLGGGSLFDYYLYSPEFASFDMVVRSVGQSENITDIMGGRSVAFYRAFIEPFLYVIPRSIWPEKPEQFVDLAHGFYANTFGGGLTGSVGYSATLIGYAHVLGGPLAVVFAFILLGALCRFLDTQSGSNPSSLAVRALGIVVAFTIFRQGSIGWVFLIVFQTMTPILIAWTLIFLLTRKSTDRNVQGMRFR